MDMKQKPVFDSVVPRVALKTNVEVSPKFQIMFRDIHEILQHPMQYTQILHQTNSFLHLYDETTMEKVARTKVQVLQSMRLFTFSNDFNVFYGIRQQNFIMIFDSRGGILNHKNLTQHWTRQQRACLMNISKISYCPDNNILIIVGASNFRFVSAINFGVTFNQPLIHEGVQLLPNHMVEVSPDLWILGCRDLLYLLYFREGFKSFTISKELSLGGQIQSIHTENHPKKQFVYALLEDGDVIVLYMEKNRNNRLNICYRFYLENEKIDYLCFLRPGINTSTTNKFRNVIQVIIFSHQMLSEMISEGQESDKASNAQNMRIVPMLVIQRGEVYVLQELNSKKNLFCQNIPVLKKRPWVNVLSENKVFFLSKDANVYFVDCSKIKELGMSADQWACMGYKFEILTSNEVYQEKQDEFQRSQQQEEDQLTVNFLNDWSSSLIKQREYFGKRTNRIKIFQN